MTVTEVQMHTRTDYICANADEKPTDALINSTLWVWDIDTYFITPDGKNWIKVKGDNSIFANPGVIVRSGVYVISDIEVNESSGLSVIVQSGIGITSYVPSGVRTRSILLVSDVSGGVTLLSGNVVSATVKPLSGGMYLGGTAGIDMPYSGYGFLVASAQSVSMDINNFNAIKVCAIVSGDPISYMGVF